MNGCHEIFHTYPGHTGEPEFIDDCIFQYGKMDFDPFPLLRVCHGVLGVCVSIMTPGCLRIVKPDHDLSGKALTQCAEEYVKPQCAGRSHCATCDENAFVDCVLEFY